MSENPPIDLIDVCQLPSLGINPQFFNFMATTLESDHYIAVRETTSSGNAVAIVDLKNNNTLTRKSMSADSVIMHPTQNVIALRANGTTLQVFNLGTKQRLKSNVTNEAVIFWKWLDEEVIGLVTASSIFTWNVFDGSDAGPALLTSRHVSLANSQLTQLVSNYDHSWFALCGIAQENGAIVGHIQF
ncbi:unnamed protein product [Ambrosiozyma monospora]|uniref:Unnamed protein product n=1 Tax=Ambrosiozyma monospora TaxID=43982 RepID=A0A9W6YWS1_AMBMO|nr:unnamed protein product [Ambrosiozyma monospora]